LNYICDSDREFPPSYSRVLYGWPLTYNTLPITRGSGNFTQACGSSQQILVSESIDCVCLFCLQNHQHSLFLRGTTTRVYNLYLAHCRFCIMYYIMLYDQMINAFFAYKTVILVSWIVWEYFVITMFQIIHHINKPQTFKLHLLSPN